MLEIGNHRNKDDSSQDKYHRVFLKHLLLGRLFFDCNSLFYAVDCKNKLKLLLGRKFIEIISLHSSNSATFNQLCKNSFQNKISAEARMFLIWIYAMEVQKGQ